MARQTTAISFTAIFALITALLGGSLIGLPAQAAGPTVRPCAPVEVVFARGSGQSVSEAGKEAVTFMKELRGRIDISVPVNFHELSKSEYPAVPVGLWHPINTAGAKVSSGEAFTYGDSVNTGVKSLNTYLKQRSDKCKTSQFVLAGYSQGAQVVGEAYVEKLTSDLRSRIVYNALFGDPKLYLPEGEGIWPPRCQNDKIASQWRVDVPNCNVDNGSLGARKPYLPDTFIDSTGLWCHDHDFVCGSSQFVGDTSGHMTYPSSGAIAEAARLAAKRLKLVLPKPLADAVDDSVPHQAAGSTGLDVVFLIDSTGSMSGKIEAAKTYAATMASKIQALNGRVALVEYRDAGDDPEAMIRSGLQEDTKDFQSKLSVISAGGGGDTPEAALHALMTAFNGLKWRSGATKAAVVLTDAAYHDPDMIDGATTASVAKRSLEIDPVNVYPVVDDVIADSYIDLAAATSGQVIPDTGDTVAALTTALSKVADRPVAALGLPDYYAPTGGTMGFSAAGSYPVGTATITKYDWDFNGDGTFDATTTVPDASHTYSATFEGLMQVRVTDSKGAISNASAKVHIGTPPPVTVTPKPPVNLKASVISTVGTTDTGITSTVELTWASGDPISDTWGVRVNGSQVARARRDLVSVNLTDVRRDAPVEFTVAGITADGAIGSPASVTLDDAAATVPVPTTTPTPTPAPSSPAPSGSPSPSTEPSVPATPISSPAQTVKPAAVPAPTSPLLRLVTQGTPPAPAAGGFVPAPPNDAPAISPAGTPTAKATTAASQLDPTDPPIAAPSSPSVNTPRAEAAGSDTGFNPLPLLAGGLALIVLAAALGMVYRRRQH